jgi:fructose-1,6-bisphosphatase I
MAPALVDYLTERTTPETGAVILGLSAAAAGMAIRLAGFGNPTAPEATAAIDTNTPPGSPFSIYPAASGTSQIGDEASFLRPGTDQTAAGCVLYGPRTTLALTTGHGTALFVLDRAAATFRLGTANLEIPPGTAEFAANAADYRLWEPPVQRFVDDRLSGAEGPRAQNFDMRWTGSIAAELHRILIRGGIYLAPQGTPAPHPLVYHCHPVAMLIEQAGGRATDGRTRLLDTTAPTLDAPSPLVFGLPEKVDRVAAYHDMPDSEASPLFGRRGLFRL